MPIIIKPSQLEESVKLGAQFRHCIHEEPEIGLYLPKTQEKIVNALKSFGIKEISTFVGGANVTGVVAVIEGSRPGKTIGLRADSDALPLEEKTGVEWSSKVPMAMHACGHDAHISMLLTAARVLAEHQDELKCTVKLIFRLYFSVFTSIFILNCHSCGINFPLVNVFIPKSYVFDLFIFMNIIHIFLKASRCRPTVA